MLCRLFDCGRKRNKSHHIVPPPAAAVSLKLAIMGDVGVGKSQLVNQFANSKFDDRSESTISIGIAHKNVEVDNTTIKMLIYDMAGQERFRLINKGYCKADIFAYFVVVDLSSIESFERARKMIEELANLGHASHIFLVGNKSDLGNRAVTAEMLNAYKDNPENHVSQYFEVSAKENKNVDEMFFSVAKLKAAELVKLHQSNHPKAAQILSLTPREQIIQQLDSYVQRISRYQSYDEGFVIFGKSRALNREANYLFAQELLKQLRTTSATLDEVFENLETKRNTLIVEKGINKQEGYVERGIWGELNTIHRHAKKFIAIENRREDLALKAGRY